MRNVNSTERDVLRTSFKLYARAEVRDSELNWQPLHDLAGINWFWDFTWREGLDNAIQSGTLTLHRSVGSESLAPLMTSSSLNQITGPTYSPLIHPGRWFRFYTAVIPHSQAAPLAGDWRQVFMGKISRVAWEKSPIQVDVYDLGIRIANRYIKDEIVYGGPGVDMETVIQELLDNNGALATLVTPVSPNFPIAAYKQPVGQLLEAIRLVALQAGFEARYRWAATGDDFDFTLYEPPRSNTTPDTSFGPSEYIDVTNLDIDDEDVRNYIQGAYIDAISGFQVREVENTVSQTEFDAVKFMRLSLNAATHIDTAAEMDAMLNAALSDLSAPMANQSIETMYFWPVQLGDLYTFEANGVHYDEDQDWAVVGYQHRVTAAGRGRTSMSVRGTPAGAYKRWINLGAGTPVSATPTMPIVSFGALVGEGTADGDQPYGMVRLPITWGQNCHRVHVYITYSLTPGQPTPPTDVRSTSIILNRPEGDVCQADGFFMYHDIRAETNEYVAVLAFGENTDTGQLSLPHTDEAQAIDSGTPPSAPPSSISAAVAGDAIAVTVDKGDLDADLLIFRNRINVAVIPGDGVTASFQFDDTGLSSGVQYNYVAQEFRNGQTSGQVATGDNTGGGSDDANAPVLVYEGEGTQNGIPYVEFSWSGNGAYATGLTLEVTSVSNQNNPFFWFDLATGLAVNPGAPVRFFGGVSGEQFAARLRTEGPNPELLSNTVIATWGSPLILTNP